MNYRSYAPKNSEGKNLESRKVRKASRKEKFLKNKALHSARAKKEARDAKIKASEASQAQS